MYSFGSSELGEPRRVYRIYILLFISHFASEFCASCPNSCGTIKATSTDTTKPRIGLPACHGSFFWDSHHFNASFPMTVLGLSYCSVFPSCIVLIYLYLYLGPESIPIRRASMKRTRLAASCVHLSGSRHIICFIYIGLYCQGLPPFILIIIPCVIHLSQIRQLRLGRMMHLPTSILESSYDTRHPYFAAITHNYHKQSAIIAPHATVG